ncbi:hypothetical protein [Kocuria rosea]|uniref:hypothetical protein n=1 Tax=Kocuria rosea TaxID=1275 RepID=UPI002540AE5F|nr:hypothetical protein [Kocuria rosea]WIG19341.1 hypothetical protein QOY29_18055 [Kocuria rosea]
MIPNITKGDKPVGLMKYLVGPGRANEHTDPHLVGGSPLIMSWHDDVQLNEEAAVGIAREVDLNRRMLGFDADTKHIWHCSLSIPYQDREVTDQEWSDIAARFMDEMDFTEGRSQSPRASGSRCITGAPPRATTTSTSWPPRSVRTGRSGPMAMTSPERRRSPGDREGLQSHPAR